MVRPVSFKGFQKGFQGVSLRGFRGFQIFLWDAVVNKNWTQNFRNLTTDSHILDCRLE